MHRYAQNMQKYAKICSDPTNISPMHSYVFICTKYSKICKICKHESYMQNMQKYALPTLLMVAEAWLVTKIEQRSLYDSCLESRLGPCPESRLGPSSLGSESCQCKRDDHIVSAGSHSDFQVEHLKEHWVLGRHSTSAPWFFTETATVGMGYAATDDANELAAIRVNKGTKLKNLKLDKSPFVYSQVAKLPRRCSGELHTVPGQWWYSTKSLFTQSEVVTGPQGCLSWEPTLLIM